MGLKDQQITNIPYIIQIYNEPGTTRAIARKFSRLLDINLTTSTIARIKGGTGPYREIIQEYKR